MFENIFLWAHLAFLATAVVGILIADTSALQWLRGKRDVIQHSQLILAHYIVTVALVGMVATGLYLFWPMREYLLSTPLFYIKMVFVATLIINALVIDRLMHVATIQSFNSLTPTKKITLLVSGTVSMVCWVGAAIVALLLFGI